MSKSEQPDVAVSEREIQFKLNGDEKRISVPPNKTLVQLLREELRMTGTTEGCGVGVCGSCTVLVDGRMVSSCLELAVNVDGSEVRTVEGLDDPDTGTMHPVQETFQDNEGFQCGYCTPGILMSTVSLLESEPNPEDKIRTYLSENICRCTGYKHVIDSVEEAIDQYREDRQ